MTAADQADQNVKISLANRGRPHMTAEVWFNLEIACSTGASSAGSAVDLMRASSFRSDEAVKGAPKGAPPQAVEDHVCRA